MKTFYTGLLIPLIFVTTFAAQGQSGQWNVLKPKNNEVANRNECGMAAINGQLYLLGGGGKPQAVLRFDPATRAWIKLATAPVLMNHFQAVPYNNKIYVLDAFYSGNYPNQLSLPNVSVYDIQKDIWVTGGEIPPARRRAGAGAVAYKGKLYLIAGILHGHASGTTNMFDSYDPETGGWTSLPDAPHIRDHCSAAVINDQLYIAGGRNTSFRDPSNKITFYSQTVLEVDCFDFVTGKWSTLPAKLPLGSGGGALVNLDGVLYYIGGERATDIEINAPRKNTYYLDPSTQGQWTETDNLNYARNGLAAAVLNDKIYVAGGSGGSPGGPGYNLGTQAGKKLDDGKARLQQPSKNTAVKPINTSAQPDKLTMEVFSIK